MLRPLLTALFSITLTAAAQPAFFPLRDVRPGLHGTGRTVFSGTKVEEFQVEILGVLENIGPKQSLILARLSGGPLEHTGVIQGMSGSPVYIDGKLVGAVAMAFPFAKDPIAGIRPIADMLALPTSAPVPARRASSVTPASGDLTAGLPRPASVFSGDARMVDIATPVSFGGFTQATLDHFAPQLRALGLEPRQGVTGGGRIPATPGNPASLEPGSMISVQLLSGDLSIGADGTVTHIDGNRIWAFGHRFLAVGATALPFARAEVLTLLPNINTSFKLSAAREWMGTVQQDRATAISGELGVRPRLVPVSIALSREGKKLETYKMQMINDRMLAPLLLQLAVFSSIDATERTLGASTFRLTGEIQLDNSPAPIRIDNMFSGDNGTAAQAALSAAIPLAFAMQSGFDKLDLRSITINLESFDAKKQLQIDQVAAAHRDVRPGETIELAVTLTGDNGIETVRRVKYAVPIGTEPGPLFFTVADGNVTNLVEFRQLLNATLRTPAQLINTVNNLRPNTRAYIRVWRTDPAFQLEGEDLPDPPASVAIVLTAAQTGQGAVQQVRNSKLGELEIDLGDMVVSGNKTIQVDVKE